MKMARRSKLLKLKKRKEFKMMRWKMRNYRKYLIKLGKRYLKILRKILMIKRVRLRGINNFKLSMLKLS